MGSPNPTTPAPLKNITDENEDMKLMNERDENNVNDEEYVEEDKKVWKEKKEEEENKEYSERYEMDEKEEKELEKICRKMR